MLNIYTIPKKLAPKVKPFEKSNFWGVHLGSSWEAGTPKLRQFNCLLNTCCNKKKNTDTLNQAAQKSDFGGPFGESSRGWYPQAISKYLSVIYPLIKK